MTGYANAASNALPYTGFDLPVFVAVAVVIVLAGVILRRASAR